jgi:hypothetical protein
MIFTLYIKIDATIDTINHNRSKGKTCLYAAFCLEKECKKNVIQATVDAGVCGVVLVAYNYIQARMTIAALPAKQGLDVCGDCSGCTAFCR